MKKLERIAGFFFPQYKTGLSTRFGSRLLDFYGRLFMGAPEQLGLEDVPLEHRKTFYWLREDRYALPKSRKSDLQAYMQDNIKMTMLRLKGSRRGALTFGVMAMVVCLGIATVGAGLHVGVDGVKRTASSLRQKIAPSDAEQQEMEQANGWTRQRCVEALAPFYNDPSIDTPEFKDALTNCKAFKDHRAIEADAKALAEQLQ